MDNKTIKIENISSIIVTGIINSGTNLEKKAHISIPVSENSLLEIVTQQEGINNLKEDCLYNFYGGEVNFNLHMHGNISEET